MIRTRLWLTCILFACGGGTSATTTPGRGAGPGPADAVSPGTTDLARVIPGAGTQPPLVARGTPSTTVLDRALFFGNPARAGVQISPDGKHLSWLAAHGGVMNVWVAPVGELGKARAITADTVRPIREYEWAYDNRHVLVLQDKGGDENFHLIRVAIADGTAADLTPLDGVRAMMVKRSPRKPGRVVVALNDRDRAVFDLVEIDLAAATRTRLGDNTLGFADWLVDDDLRPRLATKVEPDGSKTLYRPDGQGWTVDSKVGVDDDLEWVSITGRGDQAYATDNRGRDTRALVLVDLPRGKPSKVNQVLFTHAKADVVAAELHPRTRAVQWVSAEHARMEHTVLDRTVAADLAGLATLGEGDRVVQSRSLDDKRWVVAVNGDRQPTQFYLWDRGKKAGTLLFSARPELDGKPLARMHAVTVPARDGLELVSYLSVPPAADPDGDGKVAAPVPAVLLVHGGPWARERWSFHPLHQLLTNRGYAVLSVNFRGSTGFGKKFLTAGNGEWGKKMHDDLLDARAWLVAGGVAPADKVAIMGGSYGGYATLVGLSMTPDAFAAGVDIVGPSNILTLVESLPPYWAPLIGIFRSRMGDWSTAEGRAALAAVSPLTHVGRIKRPLLIGQGANDPRVKQAESDQIVKAMQARRIPVTYALFADEGHGFARPANNLAFLAAAEAFLSAHLGGVYQPVDAAGLADSSIQIVTGKDGIPGWP